MNVYSTLKVKAHNGAGRWHVTWWRSIAVFWLVIFIGTQYEHVMPVSFYFEPKRLHVEDAYLGQPHMTMIDREIHRPFKAKWYVTVRRRVGEADNGVPIYRPVQDRHGRVICNPSGEDNYSPDAAPPPEFTLRGWWMSGDSGCTLSVGAYVVDTLWEIQLSRATRYARLRSNEFRVIYP